MTNNTDNPAFPIIEFLKAEIKVAEERKEYFLSKQMIDSYKMANHFKIAYEEVLKFIEETFEDEAPLEAAINTETPIEIPSVEEILKRAKEEPDNLEITESHRIGYIAGAKWLRDKILNQNK